MSANEEETFAIAAAELEVAVGAVGEVGGATLWLCHGKAAGSMCEPWLSSEREMGDDGGGPGKMGTASAALLLLAVVGS